MTTEKKPDYTKDRNKSIWDKDVDFEKVQNLTPEQKRELFPNDYNSDGMPYGDF